MRKIHPSLFGFSLKVRRNFHDHVMINMCHSRESTTYFFPHIFSLQKFWTKQSLWVKYRVLPIGAESVEQNNLQDWALFVSVLGLNNII